MDHPFENLNDERFQELCQALLVRDNHDTRCFPIGQPDGGRDALSKLKGEFTVFQVKFKRKDEPNFDVHKWLTGVIQEEIEKVNELVNRGVSKYVLMTNARGSAHLDNGSIDKVEALLGELPVPATCLWRDDLNKLLENEWALKWIYPELMTGPDLIRALVEGRLSEHAERRSNTIRAFLSDRYTEEEEVRFKQVDLQNNLLDLFIDLPIGIREQFSKKRGSSADRFNEVLGNIAAVNEPESVHIFADDRPLVRQRTFSISGRIGSTKSGAASFLLHKCGQESFPWVLLEGAPGQGKSTITQYICQIHRMRLLGKHNDLSKIPDKHSTSPLRLPFRVDLREFASWLQGKDPYDADRSISRICQSNCVIRFIGHS